MVTVIGYETRKNKENKAFMALNLQGDLVLVQSNGRISRLALANILKHKYCF